MLLDFIDEILHLNIILANLLKLIKAIIFLLLSILIQQGDFIPNAKNNVL